MCVIQLVSTKRTVTKQNKSTFSVCHISINLKTVKSTVTDVTPFKVNSLNTITIMAITDPKLMLQIHVTWCYM